MSRLKILKKVVLVVLAIIAMRLFFIQIIEHDAWVAKANEAHTMLETIVARRGEIYMMDGNTPVAVVMNQTTYSIIIDPAVTDKDKIKESLNKNAKDYITADIDEIFGMEGLRYYIIAKNVPHSIATKIAEEGIDGVWFQKNSSRVYPEGEMASELLGFVNAEGIGQYGIEGAFNDVLKGTDGLLKSIADVNNIALSIGDENVKIPAVDGENVVLTVDRGLERGIEEIAANAIANTDAENAAVLVMDANTSEVLAMASLPNYDPKNYGYVKDASEYINQVTEVPYEPASVCKSFAFSAAINEGRMTADTEYYNEGYDIIDGWKIENAEKRSSLYGTINMRKALYWSLNTGSIKALKLLGTDPDNITKEGREKLYTYYHDKFRLGIPTGIELAESYGVIPDPNEGYGRDSAYAIMTFGQGLTTTMLQTAVAFNAVVNGGYYRTPTIIKGMLKDGVITPRDRGENDTEEQILTAETSNTMRDLLINNRDYKVRNGIDREGYAVGGKTGTAQVVVDGAYDNTMTTTIGSYVGFVATAGEMPKYIIMTKVWADGQALSGAEAGYLFDDISNYVINYLKIKPKV